MAWSTISFDDVMVSGAYAPPLQYEYKLVPKASPITWTFDPKADPTAIFDFGIEVIRVPNGRPYIAQGNHPHQQNVPVRLGCTMEMVSVLAGERWSDEPRTAHPLLSQVMRNTNDMLPDLLRQDMLQLVPRLVDTSNVGSLDWELNDAISWLYQQSAVMNPTNPYDVQQLLHGAHHALDLFDRRLDRPKQELDQQVLTRLMTALAA